MHRGHGPVTRVMDRLKSSIRRIINAVGYDIVGYGAGNPRARLARLLDRHGITLVLDVGANRGDFAWDMRELGYRGRIISFEPLSQAFEVLAKRAERDGRWTALPIGVGDKTEERILNVAANSQSSSLLPMLEAHAQAAPESRYETQMSVSIRPLDEALQGLLNIDDRIFLKIDTQGYEKHVLDGASRTLALAPLVLLECSLVALYDGALLIEDVIGYMRERGYAPVDLTPTFHHAELAHLMQVDGLFARAE
jgi:FkbM family methyltransferase